MRMTFQLAVSSEQLAIEVIIYRKINSDYNIFFENNSINTDRMRNNIFISVFLVKT